LELVTSENCAFFKDQLPYIISGPYIDTCFTPITKVHTTVMLV